MTKEQAIKLAESKWWIGMKSREIVKFQLFEEKLCMDFSDFHKALEESLGRPVYTHELGLNYEEICKEFLGEASKPSLEDIINLIPEDKRVIIVD